MAREFRHVRRDKLRDADPCRSDAAIEQDLDREDLEWDIEDIRDLDDVRRVLRA